MGIGMERRVWKILVCMALMVKEFAKDMESEVSYITIKMLNADKHYHKLNFYKSLRDELMPIAWHPDRVMGLVSSITSKGKGEAEQRWGTIMTQLPYETLL